MPLTKKKRNIKRNIKKRFSSFSSSSSHKHKNKHKNTYKNKYNKRRKRLTQKGGWWPFSSKKTEITPKINDYNIYDNNNIYPRGQYDPPVIKPTTQTTTEDLIADKCNTPPYHYANGKYKSDDVRTQYDLCCPKTRFGFKNTSNNCNSLYKLYQSKLHDEREYIKDYTKYYNMFRTGRKPIHEQAIGVKPTLTGLYDLHQHYNKWCPKTRFGFKNTSEYCRNLDKDIIKLRDELNQANPEYTQSTCGMSIHEFNKQEPNFKRKYYDTCCNTRKGLTSPEYCSLLKNNLPGDVDDNGEPDLDS